MLCRSELPFISLWGIPEAELPLCEPVELAPLDDGVALWSLELLEEGDVLWELELEEGDVLWELELEEGEVLWELELEGDVLWEPEAEGVVLCELLELEADGVELEDGVF